MVAANTKYWVAFNAVQGIGPTRVRRLLNHFGDLEQAWLATPLDLAAAGMDRRSIESIVAARAALDLDALMDKAAASGVGILTWDDEAYPRLLRPIPGAPPVLYVRGSLTQADEWAVAVVGTRHATSYGHEAAAALAGDLARHRITIVSGLARGIDGIAHRAAQFDHNAHSHPNPDANANRDANRRRAVGGRGTRPAQSARRAGHRLWAGGSAA